MGMCKPRVFIAMQVEVITDFFIDDGDTPNNPLLPIVIMRVTGETLEGDMAAWFESQFTSHGWGAVWRWGIYPFHHYHSTNHEVLGVSKGEARLILGGAQGKEYRVTVEDVIVIPAGVGHKCQEASSDFEVVGAYPRGHEPDLVRSGEGDIGTCRQHIAKVPLPEKDPIQGKEGPLFNHWKS